MVDKSLTLVSTGRENITDAMEYEIINIVKTAYDAKGGDLEKLNEISQYIANVLKEKYGKTWNVVMF